MEIRDNKIVGEVSTQDLIWTLRGYAVSLRASGNELGANLVVLAADRLAELEVPA